MLSGRWAFLLLSLVSLSHAQVDPKQNLLYAAGEGDLKLVRALLAKGADVNYRSDTGETPLHVAGIKCNKAVVAALLGMGANVNAATDPGQAMSMTPLHWYVNMNACDEATVTMLLDAGADMTLQNSQGQTPLDMVTPMKDRAEITALLRRRAAEAVTKKKDEL